ncbi:hypothetical protein KY284_020006 [Solanum tuberosum]|nr:hypothetical protein KY284_020006 [Solanum tuberosum]
MEECLLLRQSKVQESCREQRTTAIPMPKVHPFQKRKGKNFIKWQEETIAKDNSHKIRENVQLLDKQKGEERETTKKTGQNIEILTTKDWINKAFGKFMQGDSSSKSDHKSAELGVPSTENQLTIVNKADEHNSESESSSNLLMTDKEIKEIENVTKASNNNSSQSQELIMNASEEFISLTDKVSYTNQSLAILEVPTTIQTDDSQVIMVNLESPNKILHDIITHKVGEHNEVGKCGAYQCAIPIKKPNFQTL